jgi:4-hydroxythreonine-4-phosphate dehydrogenase
MRIAVSIGDLNGIGAQIALESHEAIKKLCDPVYFVDKEMIFRAADLLGKELPEDFTTVPVGDSFTLEPSQVTEASGRYAYLSFKKAVDATAAGKTEAVVTMPIHKEAWSLAGVNYKGHTDMLRDFFKKEAIMMLGRPGFYVALYTEHIPLKDLFSHINEAELVAFLLTLHREMKEEKIAVLGLNPHAGDGGVLGDEDRIVTAACQEANRQLGRDVFDGALVPDTAFTPHMRERYRLFVAMYHDQGLAPLKALYFEESINVSLNLPIIRTSVDHGTAFDIAYKGQNPGNRSYLNAVREAVRLAGIKAGGRP